MGMPKYEVWILDRGRLLRGPLGERVVLGRAPECALRVENPALSRLHCRLEPHALGIKITDLQSRNGISIDGQLISQAILRPASMAAVGEDLWIQAVRAGDAPRPWPAAVEEEHGMELEASCAAASSAGQEPFPEPPAGSARPPAAAPSSTVRSGALRGDSRRSVHPLIPVAAVVGILGILLAVLLPGGGASPAESGGAGPLFAELNRALADLRHEDGERLAARILAEHPETPEAREVAARMDVLRTRTARARELGEDLAALAGPYVAVQGYGEAMGVLRRLKPELDALLGKDAFPRRESELRRLYEERGRRLLVAAEEDVRGLLVRGQFGPALHAISDLQDSGVLLGESAMRAAALRTEVEAASAEAWSAILAGIESLPADQALAALAGKIGGFTGAPEEGALRARIAMGRIAASRSGESDVEVPAEATVAAAPAPAEAPGEEALASLTEAERAASERRFDDALQAYDRALAAVPAADRRRLQARRERIALMAAAKDGLIAAIRERPAQFRNFDTGTGPEGRVESADRDRVQITLGRGVTIRWDWRRMNPARLESLAVRSGLQGRALAGVGAFFLELDDRARAEGWLAGALAAHASLADLVNPLAAAIRHMDEVPAGGFFAMGGKLLTLDERDEALFAARLASLADRVRDEGSGAMKEALAELAALGERGAATAVAALEGRLGRLRGQALDLPLLQRGIEGLRSRFFQALQERRSAALALIRDEARYPYPYGPNGEEVQREVDGLVDAVREVWQRPHEHLAKMDEGFARTLDGMREAASLMTELGGTDKALQETLAAIAERISLPSYGPDARTQSALDRNRQVKAHNEKLLADGVVTADELDCYHATNAYREMMGLGAVMGEASLVECARGHSEEMQRLGYFSHTSPVDGRRSPGDRARLAGWGGGVSENIARGQPTGRAAVGSWIRSSGHHRNILGAGWTHLGVGKSPEGLFWTQNFARGAAKVPAGN